MAYQDKNSKKQFITLLKSQLGFNTRQIGVKIAGFYSNKNFTLIIKSIDVLPQLKKVKDFAKENNCEVEYSEIVSGAISDPHIKIVEDFLAMNYEGTNKLHPIYENMLLGWYDGSVEFWVKDIDGRSNHSKRRTYYKSAEYIAFYVGLEKLLYDQTELLPYCYNVGNTFVMQDYDSTWYFAEVTKTFRNKKVNHYEILLSNGKVRTEQQWMVYNSNNIKSFEQYKEKCEQDKRYALAMADRKRVSDYFLTGDINIQKDKKVFKMSNRGKCNSFEDFAERGFDLTEELSWGIMILPNELYKIFSTSIMECFCDRFTNMPIDVLKIQNEDGGKFIYAEVNGYDYIRNIYIEA